MLDVRRRHFIAALGGAAAWPLVVRAQHLKTAKALGLEVPATLLAIADEVVE